MNRRGFFGSLIGAVGAAALTTASAPSDPLVPYARVSIDPEKWQFLRESEIKWLNDVLPLVNKTVTDCTDVIVEKTVGGGPIIHKHDGDA